MIPPLATRYRILAWGLDAAGNKGVVVSRDWFIDTSVPTGTLVFTSTPQPVISTTVGVFSVQLQGDTYDEL